MYLGGGSELDQPALVEYEDQIGDVHAEMAVPGSESGDPPHRGSDEVHDLFPVHHIKTRGDLIQQQHPRPTDKGSGYRQPLPLTTGERIRRLPHRGVQPALTGTDRLSQPNLVNDLPTPIIINITPQQQVVTHRPTEQRTRLLDVADLTPVLIIIMLTKRHPIHHDRPLGGNNELLQQRQHRRLTRTRRTSHRHPRTSRNTERHPRQRVLTIPTTLRVPHRHITETNLTHQTSFCRHTTNLGDNRLPDLDPRGRLISHRTQINDPLQRSQTLRHIHHGARAPSDRSDDQHHIHEKRHQLLNRQNPRLHPHHRDTHNHQQCGLHTNRDHRRHESMRPIPPIRRLEKLTTRLVQTPRSELVSNKSPQG